MRRAPLRELLIGGALLSAVLGAGIVQGVVNARGGSAWLNQDKDRYTHRYARAMHWLMRNSEPGEVVFHTDWDDFGPMFFHNHRNHYLIGFDPYFFYLFDKDRYLLWRKACHGELSSQETEDAVRSFGAAWVFSSHEGNWTTFLSKLKRHGIFEVAYEDVDCTILRVR